MLVSCPHKSKTYQKTGSSACDSIYKLLLHLILVAIMLIITKWMTKFSHTLLWFFFLDAKTWHYTVFIATSELFSAQLRSVCTRPSKYGSRTDAIVFSKYPNFGKKKTLLITPLLVSRWHYVAIKHWPNANMRHQKNQNCSKALKNLDSWWLKIGWLNPSWK